MSKTHASEESEATQSVKCALDSVTNDPDHFQDGADAAEQGGILAAEQLFDHLAVEYYGSKEAGA